MNLTKLTNPETLPITLNAAKDHLRIERTETAFDDDLRELIGAAKEFVETETHLTLITTEYSASFDGFPDHSRFVKLPAWPVQSVELVEYIDADGDTVEITDYQTQLVQCPAKIYLDPDSSDWPETQENKIGSVTIEFTAGYGENATAVPFQVRHILKLLIGHWFRNREAVLTGIVSKEIELAVNALRNQVRVNEFEEFWQQ
jgi:uncharacterized phiE125 gp8 family phage protein